jgi:glycosyltransferase involved in cell wall biosynthesis
MWNRRQSQEGAKPILLFAPSERGGIAEYIHAQALELSRRGLRCVVLCTKGFLPDRGHVDYEVLPDLVRLSKTLPPGLARKLAFAAEICIHRWQLMWSIVWMRPRFVLLEAPDELLVFLWVWPHMLAARIFGVRYILNIGDPRRDRLFGPEWLHAASVWLSYSFVSAGLIHYIGESRPEWIPDHVQLIEVPMGPLRLTMTGVSRDWYRRRRGIPDDCVLFLSFGHIVDRKNIDLFIRAMRSFPQVGLLVAGSVASGRDRPGSYYRALAVELGLGERVFVDERFVPNDEIAGYFEAADMIALTYRGAYVSQSGVPYLALHWDKPMLVSAGPGPLLKCVERFNLGLIVTADSEAAIKEGIQKMLTHEIPVPDWEGFRKEASWELNIDRLLEYADRARQRASG